ncbi:hypothetical protein CRV24_007316 [Beauveria bassiana]|nr:hypothetical protein CRV24_007316 [Beauveria bassiana]
MIAASLGHEFFEAQFCFYSNKYPYSSEHPGPCISRAEADSGRSFRLREPNGSSPLRRLRRCTSVLNAAYPFCFRTCPCQCSKRICLLHCTFAATACQTWWPSRWPRQFCLKIFVRKRLSRSPVPKLHTSLNHREKHQGETLLAIPRNSMNELSTAAPVPVPDRRTVSAGVLPHGDLWPAKKNDEEFSSDPHLTDF